MKKVIRGRVYDTQTAREIGSVSGGAEFTNDFNYWDETFYCKKTGEYFLFCRGGALSRYAERIGTNSGWGESIRPLSYEEAKQWAEKNLVGDIFIAEFGDPEDDVSKVQIHVNIKKGNADKIKQTAQKKGVSVSELIDRMIEEL